MERKAEMEKFGAIFGIETFYCYQSIVNNAQKIVKKK